MIVFLTGASGFIGRRLAAALAAKGHELVLGAHRSGVADLPGRVVAVDFVRDRDPSHWRARLQDVDVVINTVGILRERETQTFEALHEATPRALFAAAAEARVKKVIQLSALGADSEAQSRYHVTKRAADEFLASLPIDSAIVQPSLVYGPGGASARLFDTLASMPLIPVPGDGSQRVQPVHIDDLVAAIVALVARDSTRGARFPIVGPEPLGLADFLQRLRAALGFRPTRTLPVPMRWMHWMALLGDRLPRGLLDSETLAMLTRGNTADPAVTSALLGHAPRSIERFVAPEAAPAASTQALLSWQLPLLRVAIAAVWIWTGVVSMGLYPVDESYALLARLGVTGTPASILLYGAALLDIVLGIATLVMRKRHWLWFVQIAVIAGYTLIISIWLPEFWLHPYGPVLKNLPLIAAIWLIATIERRQWTT